VKRTIREHLDAQAAQQPDAAYLVAPETGHILTYRALQQASCALAHHLGTLGVQPGDKVAMLMHNGLQTVRLFMGAMYGGYCITPLNLLAHQSQLEFLLDNCDADVVFVSPDQADRARLAAASLPRPVRVIACDADAATLPGESDWRTMKRHTLDSPLDEEDAALMMFTSGTTGKPKGVVLPHRAVVSGGMFVSQAHALGPQDRVYAVLPMYHINAQIITATAPLVHGGSLVMPHRFSASVFWEQAVQHGCTWLNVVPTIIAYLINGPDPRARGLDISRLRFCRSASAPLPPSQHRAFEEKFGIGIIETMGLTETAAPCFTNPLDPARRKIGSPGQAFGNEARIADESDRPLPPGQTGEIQVRGSNLMSHYHRRPEESAKAFTADGWLRTGDLGHFDADGFVYVTGRIKELIIKGGENIAPREIDEVLLTHPALLEAAVVGMPDEHYGQDILACVVLKPGAHCDEAELRAFCREHLGAYKTPRVFRFVEELPKGPSGKVQRLKMLDLLTDATAA